ncbi:leucine rich repeat protein [Purpureocillium lavendulum]|uniref:Leucine rich repeat protein n=1 Tax=Purpureocillium lavendulum TaxID=1247861 RepID=A0AB34FPP3_9HYPO|nr:leucine rich repeat protein [Purpureocillium lavendulum]
MRVAIVAVGELARYFVEELQARGHQVVAVSRTRKSYLEPLGVEQHVAVDYEPDALCDALAGCDAAVCTLRGGVPRFAAIHAALLEACRRSATCKRFIPSAWAGNLEDFPDEPLDWADELVPVLDALGRQTDVSWSAICPGWYADYVLPARQRHLADIGAMWPQDRQRKVFTLYGQGSQLVNFTSARDTARATIRLLEHDRHSWEDFTYVSGAQMSWRQLGDLIKARDPAYTFRRKSLAQSVRQYAANESPEDAAVAIFELWGHSEALHFPWDKVERHREKYFQGLEFRSLAELADEAQAHPTRLM